MTAGALTWDQTLRFRLLEIVLMWEGRLTTNHLCNCLQHWPPAGVEGYQPLYPGGLATRAGVRPQSQGLQTYRPVQPSL